MSNSLRPHKLYSPWTSPGQNTGVGSLSLLQGIFPTQGSNPGLLHCRQILYQLSHYWGSPRILEWVAYPFSSRSSWLRNRMGSPALQAYSSPTELSGKPWNPSKIDFIKESKDALSSTTGILGGAWFTKATKNFGSAAAHSSKANLTAGIKPRRWIFWRHNSADFSYSQSLLQVTHISMCGYAPYHMVSVLIIFFLVWKYNTFTDL